MIGFCPSLSFSSPCACTLEYDVTPVCGANGQTYVNKCDASCNKVVSKE